MTSSVHAERAPAGQGSDPAVEHEVRLLLDTVRDPELPILSIADLGILRDVRCVAGVVTVVITPTYSACPAMHAIAHDIRSALRAAGHARINIETRLAPAWTTDWLTPGAHAKLLGAGIAPPAVQATSLRALTGAASVACPRCQSNATELLSEFGATACKALYRCRACLEPFDYFKCL